MVIRQGSENLEKIELKAKPYLFPKPIVIVGANVGGKPNFMPVAFVGIVNMKPPMISVAMGKSHHTNIGIRENGTFSVNTPSEDMVKITDYCGLVSGKRVDKSVLFEIFYGTLKTAPMIKECPFNMEVKVIQTVELPIDEVFIGEIVGAYSEEQYLTNDQPDVKKINPIVFSMHDDHLGHGNNYWKVGEYLGRGWSIGKEFKGKAK
jgi:flavin reductase (DIM6/NTAB) family NADH-FMN oxidoreductase RutF